jgi:hypothetical protein
LLCILVHLKTYALQVMHGLLFGMGQSRANQWIHVLFEGLKATLRPLGDTPARSVTELAQRLGAAEAEAAAAVVPAVVPPTLSGLSAPAPAPVLAFPLSQDGFNDRHGRRHRFKRLDLIALAHPPEEVRLTVTGGPVKVVREVGRGRPHSRSGRATAHGRLPPDRPNACSERSHTRRRVSPTCHVGGDVPPSHARGEERFGRQRERPAIRQRDGFVMC